MIIKILKKILYILGSIYQLFLLGHDQPGDVALAKTFFDGLLSPQGVQIVTTRWYRELSGGLIMRVLANYLFNPVETSQEWSQKGLNVYSQTVFNEEFAMNRIFCVIFDAINMLIGWGTYWAIARYSS